MNENQGSTFRENSVEGETNLNNLNKPKLKPKLNLRLEWILNESMKDERKSSINVSWKFAWRRN